MSATIRVGGLNAEQRNAHVQGPWLPVVGGPCDGQQVRNIGGAQRYAVLYRPGGPLLSPGHDYRWSGAAYVPDEL